MGKYHIIKRDNSYTYNRGMAGLGFLLCFTVAGLFLAYLIQVNSLVGYSYQIRDYQEKIEGLKNSRGKLEMEVAYWRSPAGLFKSVDLLQMVEANDIIYLPERKAVAVND